MSIDRNKQTGQKESDIPRTRAHGQYVRLHSDENPYGFSLRVPEVLGSSDLYSLPADPVGVDLRQALREYTGFAPERIVVGAGTAELTERMFHAFLEPGDALIT